MPTYAMIVKPGSIANGQNDIFLIDEIEYVRGESYPLRICASCNTSGYQFIGSCSFEYESQRFVLCGFYHDKTDGHLNADKLFFIDANSMRQVFSQFFDTALLRDD